MSTRSVIVKAESDGTYKASFVHFDGYLEKPGVGYTLWNYYNTDAKAEKLVSLGDLQGVGKYLSPSRKSKLYGWDINLDNNQTDINLFDLPQKEEEILQKDADLHTEADYRDQYAHSLYYKNKIRHPRQSESHDVQQLSLNIEPNRTTEVPCTKRLWKGYQPYHAKNWQDFLDNGPSDFEYLYLFHNHQWHCLICDELGVVSNNQSPTGLTIPDTVKVIQDNQSQMKSNWARSGESDTSSLIKGLSNIEHDLNKGMSITSMQILMNSAYQRCHRYQELYERLGMHLTTLSFNGGYNDSAFKDGKLINITDHHDDINRGHLPENKYQAMTINDAINYIKDFAYQR